MDDTPPLFKQGTPARVRAGIFVILALVMLLVDSRMQLLEKIRVGIGTILYPVQQIALMPRDLAYMAGEHFTSLSALQTENQALRYQQALNAQMLQEAHLLKAENAQLRNLMSMQKHMPVTSLVAEIQYDARDPFTRKIILSKGSSDGVKAGQPVIDDMGIVGQVTRVFPLWSEVTLLTDQDQAIPVQILRNSMRSVAYGSGQSGQLDLRYVSVNADVQKGDVLVTSGIDGVYPPGLAVATVTQVENRPAAAFANIVCQPIGGIDRNKFFLILLSETQVRPEIDQEGADDKKDKTIRERLQNRRNKEGQASGGGGDA